MILDLKHKFCFIHIPRTGGKLITHLLKPLLTMDGFFGGGCLRHIPAKHIPVKLCLPQEIYDILWKFTIYRPVNEVKESMVRLVEYDLNTYKKKRDSVVFAGHWKRVLDTADTEGYDKAIELIWDYGCWPHEEEKWRRFWICDDYGKQIVDTVYEFSKDKFSFIIKDIMAKILPEVGAK